MVHESVPMEVEAEATDFVTQKELHGLLRAALRAHSQTSDINFTVGRLPQVEVHGKLTEVALGDWNTPLTAFETRVITDAIFNEDKSLEETLEKTDPELSADLVERGLVLCGGGVLLRGLDQLIARETGLPVRIADDPLTCVARGTAIFLEKLDQYSSVLDAIEDDV